MSEAFVESLLAFNENAVRPAKLDWVRTEITRLRGQLGAHEREIGMLQRAGASTASAELLLSRTRAKIHDLCRERETLREGVAGVSEAASPQ